MGTTATTVVTINRLPEKITILIDWEKKYFTVFRHSVDAFRTIQDQTLGGKQVSYHRLRRLLKKSAKIVLDSGLEVQESIMIN